MHRGSKSFRDSFSSRIYSKTYNSHVPTKLPMKDSITSLTRAFSSDSLNSFEEFQRKRSEFSSQQQETTLIITASNRTDQITSGDSVNHNVIVCMPDRFRRTLFENDMKRSVSESLEYNRLSLDKHLGLTPYQLKLVAQSWRNIYATGVTGPFATTIFPLLCSRNDHAKKLMQKGDTASAFAQSDIDCSTMHARLTLDLIDTIIRNMDHCCEYFTDYLLEIGQCHRHLKAEGLDQELWDDFGEALLESVRKSEHVRRHKELSRAWLIILAFIIDHLKQGQMMFKTSRQFLSAADKPAD